MDLGINFEVGDIVILKRGIFKPEYQDEGASTVKLVGGFGMKSYLTGRAIGVEFLSDGEISRFNREDIDFPATNEAWEAHGGRWNEEEN